MNVYCSHCGDGFTPVEYREQPVGAEEPQFCSDDCADYDDEAEELSQAYLEAFRSAGPVFL